MSTNLDFAIVLSPAVDRLYHRCEQLPAAKVGSCDCRNARSRRRSCNASGASEAMTAHSGVVSGHQVEAATQSTNAGAMPTLRQRRVNPLKGGIDASAQVPSPLVELHHLCEHHHL